ncbi:hypothetical protein MLD38_038397 [Melastoma candidum]|uniref:Uncharacterized protein n=1 Tax=Melastoma candidum TaxID=119954 RepID=A0ACB9KZY2_9MYRT|nr:hypothetical protein MLD38_038397 [Melastoma candidum]
MMSNSLDYWPEPIVRVRSLSESGITRIPSRYVKPLPDRPTSFSGFDTKSNIPVIDLGGESGGWSEAILGRINEACRDWGFFQVVNHGVDPGIMREMREKWREFFHLPEELKAEYSNNPCTYEGYGSRLGVEKGAVLDWSDYYFLHYLPPFSRDPMKWPSQPSLCRELIAEYSVQVVGLCCELMKVLSINLGLPEDYIQEAFGGGDMGACLRANFYPKCPQPDLTLGLSSHSDPGGLTILLPDENVPGLQVRKGDRWITVKPIPDAFIVNIGDQMQVLSNARYKSVEHRVIVNSGKERVSLAYFFNPRGDILIKPAEELVTEDQPALYLPMTFNEYRLYIRRKGPCGKSQVEALKSPRR